MAHLPTGEPTGDSESPELESTDEPSPDATGASALEPASTRRRPGRRARTEPPPGTEPHPAPEPSRHSSNENAERLLADKPPHY